jgi:manganese/zinc/iron transport system permease protein
LLLAPNRGLLWDWVRQRRNRRRLQVETVLSNMYWLARQHGELDHGHSTEALRAMSVGQRGIAHTLDTLSSRGWVRRTGSERWTLTPAGLAEAERLVETRGS